MTMWGIGTGTPATNDITKWVLGLLCACTDDHSLLNIEIQGLKSFIPHDTVPNVPLCLLPHETVPNVPLCLQSQCHNTEPRELLKSHTDTVLRATHFLLAMDMLERMPCGSNSFSKAYILESLKQQTQDLEPLTFCWPWTC
jgi:hypothetical protein